MGRRYKLSDFLFLYALELLSPTKTLPVGSSPQSPVWTWDECHQLLNYPGPGDLLDTSFSVYSNPNGLTPPTIPPRSCPFSTLEGEAPETLAYQDPDPHLLKTTELANEVFAAESFPARNDLLWNLPASVSSRPFVSLPWAPGTSRNSPKHRDFDPSTELNGVKRPTSSYALGQASIIDTRTEQPLLFNPQSPLHSYHDSSGLSAGWSTASHSFTPQSSVLSQNSPTASFGSVDQQPELRRPALQSGPQDSSGATTRTPKLDSFSPAQRKRVGLLNNDEDDFLRWGRQNLDPSESAQNTKPFAASTLHRQGKLRKLAPGGENSGTKTGSQVVSAGSRSRVSQMDGYRPFTEVTQKNTSLMSTGPTKLSEEGHTGSHVSNEANSWTRYEASNASMDAESMGKLLKPTPQETMLLFASQSPSVGLLPRQAESIKRFLLNRKMKALKTR